ncbi:MAG: hypothetical protein IJC59_07030 [Lachnospiraceae bacterium]|nr:hypothetical protein [Lachnospiraceae bacterium]
MENSVRELIDEIKNENEEQMKYLKKQLNTMKLLMVCLAGILVLLVVSAAVVVPRIVETLQTVNTAVDTLSTTTVEAVDTVTGTIAVVEEVFLALNGFMDESSTGIATAIEKLNSIDIDSLNKSIKDLGEVVDPLADFFGRFH